VGEETARDLAQHFGTLEKIIENSKENINEIDSIPNIGPAVTKSVLQFFQDKNNLHFIEKLKENGVVIDKVEKIKGGKFEGLTFVLTGTLSTMSREIAKEKIIKLGGKISGSVSKNTSYVVTGEDAGSKLKSAEKLKIKILTEEEFKKMI
jgi:DNA ligase (NAD+)